MAKSLKEFEIIGKYWKKKEEYDIQTLVSAETENYAIKKVYSLIGSRHRVKRNKINILEVKKIG
ncbi:MAG: 50S ribosomal protein L18a [Promethearchaeota archaeon]|nr:MAG: 50S ribosomal protein L18a [Candidatus Lokiarchaeota archaeon]